MSSFLAIYSWRKPWKKLKKTVKEDAPDRPVLVVSFYIAVI